MSKFNRKVTFADAQRVLEIVDAGLCHGKGIQKPGKMCVEAAVCAALGLPHGDNPPCVDTTVREFKITLNDQAWSSKKARAAGLRRIAIAQLGTKDPSFDRKKFLSVLAELTIKVMLPIALRAAASAKGNLKFKVELEQAADRCEKEGTEASARDAQKVANANAAANADNAAAYAAAAAAYAANAYAAYANAAYANAAYAAAYAANAYTTTTTTASPLRDKILAICAELGVIALRAAGAQGIEWMDKLIPEAPSIVFVV